MIVKHRMDIMFDHTVSLGELQEAINQFKAHGYSDVAEVSVTPNAYLGSVCISVGAA